MITALIVAVCFSLYASEFELCFVSHYRAVGMDGFLSKPVFKNHLKKCLLSVLRGQNFPSHPNSF